MEFNNSEAAANSSDHPYLFEFSDTAAATDTVLPFMAQIVGGL